MTHEQVLLTVRQIFPFHLEQAAKLTIRKVFSSQDESKEYLKKARSGVLKPRGHLAMPSRGGYSLSKTIGWDKNLYRQVQVSTITCESSIFFFALTFVYIRVKRDIRCLARKHMDTRLPLSKQPMFKIRILCDEVLPTLLRI